MQTRKTEPRRKNKQVQETRDASPITGEASAIYTRSAEDMRQNLDAVIAAVATETAPATGTSLPLGQQAAHGVIRPASQQTQDTRSLSNEMLVQNFRQTSGE